MNNKAVIYCRTNAEGKLAKDELLSQQKICEEFAKKEGLEIVEVIKEFSNGLQHDRREVNRIIELCATDRTSHAVIATRDRLFVDVVSRVSFHHFLKEKGIGMHIVLDADEQEFIENVVFKDLIQIIEDSGVFNKN